MPIAPRVNPAPLPGVRLNGNAPDAAFGGGAGNVTAGIMPGLSAVHNEAAQIAQEEKVKADQVALTDAGAKASATMTDVLYGPDGALTKQGKDAFDTPETTEQKYFDAIGQIRASLGNDDQRDAFDRIVANDRARINEQVQRHVAQQRTAYDTDTTDALVANKQNEALNGYSDPAAVQAAIDAQKGAISGYGQRNGWSDEQTKEAVAKQVSATHFGVLSRMLDNEQDTAASQYYDAHKDELLGVDQNKIERALSVGSTQGEALRIANKLLAPKPDGSTIGAADALTQVEATDNPKVRDEAIKLVTAHFTELDRAQRIDRENARSRVLQSLNANKGRLNEASSDWQLINGYPEGEHVLEAQRQILHPPPDPGDPDKYNNYIAMAAISPETRRQLLSTNVSDIAKDPTMNATQKHGVINLIRTESARYVADVRRQQGAAEIDVKRYERDLKQAQDAGDDDAAATAQSSLFDAKQRATVLRGQLLTATRETRVGAPNARAGVGVVQSGSGSANALADTRTPANPVGLTPVERKPLTPEMTRDLAVYGAGYADYLRKLEYDVPAVLPVAVQPERPKK